MFYFQIPPTPTPLPVVDPESVPIEVDVNLWDFAEWGIQFWNRFIVAGQIVQAIVLLLLIGSIVMIIYRESKKISVIRND